MPSTLQINRQDAIVNIVFNRPEVMNALNPAMANELLSILMSLDDDQSVKVIVLSGAGPCFMAGGDVHFFYEQLEKLATNFEETIEKVHNIIEVMHNSRKIFIVAAHGSVAGVGLSFLINADLAIAAEGTKFTLAYSQIGTTPDGGATYLLPKIVGHKKAMELALFSNVFDSEEAKQLGLINQVVPETELSNAAEKLASKVATGPSLVCSRVKTLIQHSWENNLLDQLYAEQQAFIASVQTNDFKRGVTAFINKQKPEFKGD